jgi:hypothetical protein
MKRSLELLLLGIGIAIICITLLLSYFFKDAKSVLEVIGIGAAFLFFCYKLLAGWLFINLDVNIVAERSEADVSNDHLGLTVTLKKGGIDSCWVEDIQFRVSEIKDMANGFSPEGVKFIRPGGMKLNIFYHNENDITEAVWERAVEKHYVLSPDEQTSFSAYTTVAKHKVVFVEIIVIGTRPFYSILMKKRKFVQWRSSIVVLPVTKT